MTAFPAPPLRVLLVDDSAAFREGFALLLRSVGDLDLVGQAATGEEGVRQATALQPDVVVMDLHMPGLGGVEATRRIAATSPHMRVLVLTMHDDDDHVVAALRAGAHGYVLRRRPTGAACGRCRVARGKAIFGPRSPARPRADPPAQPAEPFPDRPCASARILDAGGQGRQRSHRQRLGIGGRRPCATRSPTLLVKLQVRDREQAIVKARDAGLGRS